MSYPKQDSVMRRLQAESLAALDKAKALHQAAVADCWRRTARSLREDIRTAYRWASPKGNWSLPVFHAVSRHQLEQRVRFTLARFHGESSRAMGRAFKDLRQQSALRHAWALDQVTPDSFEIKILRQHMQEAATPPATGWFERWGEWVSAYQTALMSNLRLNAMNEGGIEDAVAEVDATRANTPAYTLESALARLFDYQAADAMSEGEGDVADGNPDLVEQEVWRTRGDLRVCDDCNDNEGLTAEEADGDIPLHPNCNCFWQVVPASFAALLRSGDDADQALARQMDYEGVAPNAMVIRNDAGEVAGKAVVDFEQWTGAGAQAVSGTRG